MDDTLVRADDPSSEASGGAANIIKELDERLSEEQRRIKQVITLTLTIHN